MQFLSTKFKALEKTLNLFVTKVKSNTLEQIKINEECAKRIMELEGDAKALTERHSTNTRMLETKLSKLEKKFNHLDIRIERQERR